MNLLQAPASNLEASPHIRTMVGRHKTREVLQLRCRQLGLQDHGTKAMLSSRLQSHASNPSSATGRGHPPPPDQDHAAQDDRTKIPSANRVHQPIPLPPVQNQASIRGMQVDEEQKQEQVGRVDNLVIQHQRPESGDLAQ